MIRKSTKQFQKEPLTGSARVLDPSNNTIRSSFDFEFLAIYICMEMEGWLSCNTNSKDDQPILLYSVSRVIS